MRHANLVERELDELGAECTRVLRLLDRLKKARAEGRDAEIILGDLGASIIHLHGHTAGLDDLIDEYY